MKNLIETLIKIDDRLYKIIMNEGYKNYKEIQKTESFWCFNNQRYDKSWFDRQQRYASEYRESMLMKLNST